MYNFESTCSFTDLIKFFKLAVVLSHKQSDIERGFSINKNIFIINLLEGSLFFLSLLTT